jgi:hypothetical protein
MGLGLVISGVGKVICAFGWCDGVEDWTDRIADGLGGSLCGFSQPVFEFGEELFDRVQIGRVFRQEEKMRARGADGCSDSGSFVRTKIVHDHDIAGLQCRDQYLLYVQPEGFPIDRAVKEPGGGDAIVAQGSQEGHGLPATMRHLGLDPLTARRPAPQRRHVGFGPGLVDEYQPGGVDPLPILGPLRPAAGHVGAILLGGNQRLFL